MLDVALTHFVSDVHLQPERPDTVRRFRAYLAGPARAAAALYILGDLFEYWIGDDCLQVPGAFEEDLCADLARLRETGTAVRFIAGNRDFLIGSGFAAASRAELLPEECLVSLSGKNALLLHGDTLCTDDGKYQDFRRLVRSPLWQTDFLARPLAERLAEVASLRERSRQAISEKSAAIMDANPEAVAAAFRRTNADCIIHGHTHRQGRHEQEADGRLRQRWVLGDWDLAGNYLVADPAGWRFDAIP